MSGGWESLYHKAAGDYNNGNFKDSYNNYLKAANALLYKLSNEVTFANKDAVKSKPSNSARLFQQLKSCVQRLEDILQNRTTNGLPSPRPSFTSDIATSILTNNPHPMHLPMIPFSPLTRQSIHYAHELATTSQKLSVATQKSNENKDNLSSLRKLKEELRQQRSRLDNVNNNIQSIAEVTLLHWDVDAFAQQLTIIDSQLYGKVDFRKDLLSKDRKSSKAQACLDFHRYLTNSFAHQFIIYAEVTRSSGNPTRGVSHARDNIIAQAIRIAYLLLNVHRNFNSFAALVKSLTSPEVRRIKRLWSNLPSRVSQILKDLSLYVKKENNYKVYRDALVQKMEEFRDVDRGMIVIPWMQPHYEEIKTITQTYSSGKSGDPSEVILSAPGALKLETVFSQLERCKTNVASDDDEGWGAGRKGSPLASRGRDIGHLVVDGATVTVPLDLSCLGLGDLGLHHWIVSRVFLTKQQLIDESIEIEPLADNEQLPCVENDYEEEEEEEEEEDRVSVSQYDLRSDDSGDNIEATTSTTKSDIAITGSASQKKPYEISSENLAKSEFTYTSPSIAKTGSNEMSSNPNVNSTSLLSFEETSRAHENALVGAYMTKSTEESMSQVNSIKPEPTDTNAGSTSTTVITTKTAAIPIPQSSQRTSTPILSPASLLVAKNLNPRAPVFVPRSQSFSGSSSATIQGAIDKVNALANESAEMGETSKSHKPISLLSTEAGENELNVNNEEEDEDKFVYKSNDEEEKEEEEEDDDDKFVFTYVKEGEEEEEEREEENEGFHYTQQELNVDRDDDESKADLSFDINKKDIMTKSGENSLSPNIDVDNVITKVGESTDNSITVRINAKT